jgi:hypothetical protein
MMISSGIIRNIIGFILPWEAIMGNFKMRGEKVVMLRTPTTKEDNDEYQEVFSHRDWRNKRFQSNNYDSNLTTNIDKVSKKEVVTNQEGKKENPSKHLQKLSRHTLIQVRTTDAQRGSTCVLCEFKHLLIQENWAKVVNLCGAERFFSAKKRSFLPLTGWKLHSREKLREEELLLAKFVHAREQEAMARNMFAMFISLLLILSKTPSCTQRKGTKSLGRKCLSTSK